MRISALPHQLSPGFSEHVRLHHVLGPYQLGICSLSIHTLSLSAMQVVYVCVFYMFHSFRSVDTLPDLCVCVCVCVCLSVCLLDSNFSGSPLILRTLDLCIFSTQSPCLV